MISTLLRPAAIAAVIVPALGAPARAEEPEPDRIRGVISEVGNPSIVVKTRDGKDVRIEVPDNVSIFSLSKGRFTDVDLGTYVGAVAVKMDEYSPIVWVSGVFLLKGFELGC